MNKEIILNITKELKIKESQVNAVLTLLEEGNTVPFIARYRKEATGSLDEEQIRVIEKEYAYLVNLAKRKNEVLRLIEERGMLTDDLVKAINAAIKLQQVEDIYLPFKEKRKTKATEAIKKGLEPLSDFMLSFPKETGSIVAKSSEFITDEVTSIEYAIEGAGFIIAEKISESAKHREYIREHLYQHGVIETKAKKKAVELDEKKKFEMYYDFSQPVAKLPSYRILAFNRGEKEKVLGVNLVVNQELLYDYLYDETCIDDTSDSAKYIKEIVIDSYKRLIFPSLEREIRNNLTEKADIHAIDLFSKNLDVLIMQPPLKEKMVLGMDPAFRTGCKLAVIDKTGMVCNIDVIYPTEPKNDYVGSSKKLEAIFKQFPIDQIVIGNGTASRETESFMQRYCEEFKKTTPISIVSEAGASVYSASKVAQQEFPDLQVEQRSAVSIARRIQDPMAELVKIDPKAIGVGQYQHDVNQKLLSENLDFVMIKNINKVGVNVNTASRELLKYVSGLDSTIAKNIVDYRNEFGKFKKRSDLKKVKRLGDKAYQQAAGFLKILNGSEILDSTFIHPESYKLAKLIIKDLKLKTQDFGTEEIKDVLSVVDIFKMGEKYQVSDIIIKDIFDSFISPNIDLRDNLVVAEFDKTITKIEDLKTGIEVQGQVRNIVDFGAFVDIGLKNDALVHISQISNNFVSNVSDILSIGDVKTFKVKEIDVEKGRIQLTLREM
ncbi:MAG: Tex family protein [Mycoplasmatales bacterium]